MPSDDGDEHGVRDGTGNGKRRSGKWRRTEMVAQHNDRDVLGKRGIGRGELGTQCDAHGKVGNSPAARSTIEAVAGFGEKRGDGGPTILRGWRGEHDGERRGVDQRR